MPTILLEEIIAILKGWISDFTTYAAGVLDKLGVIKTNTNKLSDIKDNTDDIKSNTAAIITPITTIEGNVTSIKNNTDSIKTDTTIIKNNAQSIATSAGAAAAFAEDIANNTLDIDNRVVTIGSDTTQLRTNSNAMTTDLHDIKQALQYYFLTNIVTEDSEGSIANFDTDLQDYLQKAVVTIPSDANGISGLDIYNQKTNLEIATMFKGLFLGTYDFINLTQFSWSLGDYATKCFNASISGLDYSGLNILNKLVSYYTPTTKTTYSEMPDKSWTITGTTIRIRDTDCSNVTSFVNKLNTNIAYLIYLLNSSITPTITKVQFETLLDAFEYNYNNYSATFTSPITDGAEVDLLSGIVKINSSPVTYDSITPIAIRTFKGINNVYSDIGDMSVTYRETLKHYLDKQNQ